MKLISDDIILDVGISDDPKSTIKDSIDSYDLNYLITTCNNIVGDSSLKDTLGKQLKDGAEAILNYLKSERHIDTSSPEYSSIVKNFGLFVPKSRDKIYKMMESGGTFLVKFKKVSDGSVRYMACTRDWDQLKREGVRGFIPPAGNSTKKVNPNQVIIWDLGKDAFRSFRVDSLISIDKVSKNLVSYYNVYINMTLDKFVELLDTNVVKIKYRKLDGTKRDMRCTRNISGFKDESKYDKITVYDLDKRDYRNIIFENVLSIIDASDDKQKKSSLLSRIRNLFRR